MCVLASGEFSFNFFASVTSCVQTTLEMAVSAASVRACLLKILSPFPDVQCSSSNNFNLIQLMNPRVSEMIDFGLVQKSFIKMLKHMMSEVFNRRNTFTDFLLWNKYCRSLDDGMVRNALCEKSLRVLKNSSRPSAHWEILWSRIQEYTINWGLTC